MKYTKYTKLLLTLFVTQGLIINNATASLETDREIYIGAKIGSSLPVVKSFEYKDRTQKDIYGKAAKTKYSITPSSMYGFEAGYSFYPNMAVSFVYNRDPKYHLRYNLPVTEGLNRLLTAFPGSTRDSSAKSRVEADVFMINLNYKMSEIYGGLKPFVSFGAGFSKVTVKPSSVFARKLAVLGDIEYLRVLKKTTNCPTVSFGAGFEKNITKNFSMVASTTIHVVKDIKVKYETLTEVIPNKKYTVQKPVKKTMAVADFSLGLRYTLPF